MSFDLFVQRFSDDGPASIGKGSLLAELRRHCTEKPNEFGVYRPTFPDGSDVEFSAEGLETDSELFTCAFHLHGFSPHVIYFVYRVALASDAVVFNAQGEDTEASPSLILFSESQEKNLPREVGLLPVYCSSVEHFTQLLGLGVDSYTSYRNQIVGQDG